MNHLDVRYCCICSKRFDPHPRLKVRQRTGGSANCQKQQGVSTLESGESGILNAMMLSTVRSGNAIVVPTVANNWAWHLQARQHHTTYMSQWRRPAPQILREREGPVSRYPS